MHKSCSEVCIPVFSVCKLGHLSSERTVVLTCSMLFLSMCSSVVRRCRSFMASLSSASLRSSSSRSASSVLQEDTKRLRQLGFGVIISLFTQFALNVLKSNTCMIRQCTVLVIQHVSDRYCLQGFVIPPISPCRLEARLSSSRPLWQDIYYLYGYRQGISCSYCTVKLS